VCLGCHPKKRRRLFHSDGSTVGDPSLAAQQVPSKAASEQGPKKVVASASDPNASAKKSPTPAVDPKVAGKKSATTTGSSTTDGGSRGGCGRGSG
jgi:hypothetical protein